MDEGRWRRARELFEAACDLPESEWASFLDPACRGEPSLRREVQDLLEAGREAGSFLEAPAPGPEPAGPGELREGARIGRYRLLRELGRGGMGVVYLAERAEGDFHKRVALKAIRPELASSETTRRFHTERQILANLEHPHIARLLDGGTSPNGSPYFIAEYIRGQPIDRYCQRRGLSLQSRIELFMKVCGAVHFAHQNLVVHRDLKPSNILVTDQGEPKLLDFGIAKVLNSQLPHGRPHTVHPDQRPMTLEYASPEQLRRQPITTASDIYTLGVLLYELLTGQRPYRLSSSDPRELEEAIRHQIPERPSSAVLGASVRDGRTVLTAVAGAARGDSGGTGASGSLPGMRRAGRELRGDLDNILLMALEKEPASRYPSAERLASDLGRHLQGLPVDARRQSLAYRALKFAGRHRAAVALGLIGAFAMIAFAATLIVQRGQVIRERDRAEIAAGRAISAKDFMTELLQDFDPNRAIPEYSRVREEILDAAAARLESELGGEPEIQADLMTTIGVAYRNMGRVDKAIPLLRGALDLHRSAFGMTHRKVADSLSELSLALWNKGRYEEAKPMARQGLEIRQRLLGKEHPEVAASIHLLAKSFLAEGNFEAAESSFRESLAMRRRLMGEQHPEVAVDLTELGTLLVASGEYGEAEPILREALEIDSETLGDEHPRAASSHHSLALLLEATGRYEEAEALFRQALAIERRQLGDDHPFIADTTYSLAHLLYQTGDYERAEPLFREVLAMNRRLLGPEALEVAGSLNGLARLLQAKGEFEAAEPLIREALAMNRRLLGNDHRHVAASLSILANFLAAKGDLAAAQPVYLEALGMSRRRIGDEALFTATIRYKFADLLCRVGRASAGEEQARESWKILERTLPSGHWRRAEARSVLGGCLTGVRRYQEAEALLQESYSQLLKITGDHSPATREALLRLSRLSESRSPTASEAGLPLGPPGQ